MAALTFVCCAVIRELYSVTNAFIRCGCDVQKSLNYIRAKNRLRLFQKYCEAVWLQYDYESLVDYAADNSAKNSRVIALKSGVVGRSVKKIKMHRGRLAASNAEIDFAAIEATAMAREASEGYILDTVDSHFDERNGSVEENLDYETFENLDDIEVLSALEADVSYYDHIDSHPQCRENNLGELSEGVCFIVTGRILLTCERFSINFLIENSTHDVALHINPRLPQNYVVRNTRVRNVWGREEIATHLPFNLHRGTAFAIQVLITEGSFMMSSNGYHFADYKHRLPYRTIKAIEVKGDVENVKIERRLVTSYPERQPQLTRTIRSSLLTTPFRTLKDGTVPEMAFYDTIDTDVVVSKQWRQKRYTHQSIDEATLSMPYIGCFERGTIFDGRAVCIKGRIKLLPHSFYINLQDDVNIWPHQNIAFHFNPRFSTHGGATLGKAIVCRNAWYNGQWAKEERSELDTNLRPGKQFVLMIRCTHDSFIVYVDRKLITSFKYHLDPSIINTVYIRGDIKLIDVSLMVPSITDQPKTNITENPNFKNDEFEYEYADGSRIGAQVKAKGIDDDTQHLI